MKLPVSKIALLFGAVDSGIRELVTEKFIRQAWRAFKKLYSLPGRIAPRIHIAESVYLSRFLAYDFLAIPSANE